jgi:hypothetical protein
VAPSNQNDYSKGDKTKKQIAIKWAAVKGLLN